MTIESETDLSPPLTEATFLILLSLATEPKHGYAIMKDVANLSQGRAALSTGTLYGALKRLLEQGLVTRLPGEEHRTRDPGQSGRERKAYALTQMGKRILDAEIARMHELLTTARLRALEEQA